MAKLHHKHYLLRFVAKASSCAYFSTNFEKNIILQFHFLFLNISGGELVVVLLLVIMFFGANKIPEIARGLGKGIRQVRNATDELKQEINKTDEGDSLRKFKEKIEAEKKELEDLGGSVKRNIGL